MKTAFSLAGETTLVKRHAAALQLPMMATRRVVKITDIRISASGFRDTVTEAATNRYSVGVSLQIHLQIR